MLSDYRRKAETGFSDLFGQNDNDRMGKVGKFL